MCVCQCSMPPYFCGSIWRFCWLLVWAMFCCLGVVSKTFTPIRLLAEEKLAFVQYLITSLEQHICQMRLIPQIFTVSLMTTLREMVNLTRTWSVCLQNVCFWRQSGQVLVGLTSYFFLCMEYVPFSRVAWCWYINGLEHWRDEFCVLVTILYNLTEILSVCTLQPLLVVIYNKSTWPCIYLCVVWSSVTRNWLGTV